MVTNKQRTAYYAEGGSGRQVIRSAQIEMVVGEFNISELHPMLPMLIISLSTDLKTSQMLIGEFVEIIT